MLIKNRSSQVLNLLVFTSKENKSKKREERILNDFGCVMRMEGGLKILLDIDKVLNSEEILTLEKAA